MIKVYEKILEKNLTISETENLVRELLYQVKNQGTYLSSEEKSRFVKSIESLGDNVKAKLIQTRVKGKLIIEIKGNLKETTEVLKRIKRLIEKFV
jgi:predicted RNA-binding protein with RPS1 domain